MGTTTKAPKGFSVLRQALLNRTNWSKQVLSQRVTAVKSQMPMKTGIAQAIVAHMQGLRLDRYLTGTDLQQVQEMLARVGNNGKPAPVESGGAGARPRSRTKGTVARVINFRALNIKTSDPILVGSKHNEAVEMAAVYPTVYLLENSMRAVIQGVMEGRFGDDWWDKELKSANALRMKTKVEDRLKKESEQSWHQRRGAHKIDYVDLGDLLVIAQAKREVFFPQLLGKENWFQGLVEETAPSRNVLCHMNPLSKPSVAALTVRLTQWHQHLQNREAEIRAAMEPSTGAP